MKLTNIFNPKKIGLAASIMMASGNSAAAVDQVSIYFTDINFPPTYCAMTAYYGFDFDEYVLANYKNLIKQTYEGTRPHLVGGSKFITFPRDVVRSEVDKKGAFKITIPAAGISSENDMGLFVMATIPEQNGSCLNYGDTNRSTEEKYKSEIPADAFFVFDGKDEYSFTKKLADLETLSFLTNPPIEYKESVTAFLNYISYAKSGEIDVDGDGISDIDEINNGTDPLVNENNTANTNSEIIDSDFDGVSDAEELAQGTDPNNSDSDNDGLVDGYEIAVGLNPNLKSSRQDGIRDYYAIINYYNKQEVFTNSDPFWDNDGDGKINLLDPDYNHDGCLNSFKVDSNNMCIAVKPADSKWPDGYSAFAPPLEVRQILATKPNMSSCNEQYPETHTAEGTLIDSDGDGIGDWSECYFGSDVNLKDSDGDKISDPKEYGNNYAKQTVYYMGHNFYHDFDGDGRPAINDPNSYGVCLDSAKYNFATGECEPVKTGIMLSKTFNPNDDKATRYELKSYNPLTPPLEVLRIIFAKEAAIAHPDKKLDTDGDKVLDRDEFVLGLNVNRKDSNGDGISDFYAVYGRYNRQNIYPAGNLPTDDFDGDGIINLHEVDVDNDGVINSYEKVTIDGADWAQHQKSDPNWPSYKIGDVDNYPPRIKALLAPTP